MSDREEIFGRIREALAPLEEKTPYPDWEDSLAVSHNHPEFDSLWELFCYKLKQVNGTPLKGPDALAAFLKEKEQLRGYCDPEIAERLGALPAFEGIELHTEYVRERYEDYLFGITKASGAIAETGTIILKDRETSARLGALTPWTHAVMLDPEKLYADFPSAIQGVADDDPSIILVTGPSKTADVEGILIEGVHGPGTQICCLWDGF